MEIIYELNAQHLEDSQKRLGNSKSMARELSLIEDGEVKRVKMSHLALLASTSLNAVSEAQEQILRDRLFPHMLAATDKPVHTITSGVSHRRWLLGQNEPLSALITSAIGDAWECDSSQLGKLEAYAQDNSFVEQFAAVKTKGKERLLSYLRNESGFDYDLDALFDVQCMRIHPCKRQVLHLLNIVSRYIRLKEGAAPRQKRLHVFGGKAMPSDFLAKQTVALINVVADAVNGDGDARDSMRVVFIPDFGLTWADRTLPGVDLMEAIGSPLSEACPTTQFKASFGGAVTIASRGGINDQFVERVGSDAVFMFGTGTAAGEGPSYDPSALISGDSHLHEVFNWLEELLNSHSGGEDIFPLISSIRDTDRFGVVRDFEDYRGQQELVDEAFADSIAWHRRAILSLSRSGPFASDVTVGDYARQIWKLEPVQP